MPRVIGDHEAAKEAARVNPNALAVGQVRIVPAEGASRRTASRMQSLGARVRERRRHVPRGSRHEPRGGEELLRELHQRAPWAEVGYSQELERSPLVPAPPGRR